MGVELNEQKVKIYAPIVVGRKGEYYQLLYDLIDKGYEKVLIDGKEYSSIRIGYIKLYYYWSLS